jgi:4a-hydroxytetrahydrobiopterin dehydratase
MLTRGVAMNKTLSAQEIEAVLREYPGWTLHEGKLVHEWLFSDFIKAMKFVNRVAAVAEDAGHHPDIDIRYNRVTLGLVSHDAGGITERDAAMAGRISREFEGDS